MMGLSDGERISMTRSAVLIQYTHVIDRETDRQTDGIGVTYTRYSIYAVERKNGQGRLQCYILTKEIMAASSRIFTSRSSNCSINSSISDLPVTHSITLSTFINYLTFSAVRIFEIFEYLPAPISYLFSRMTPISHLSNHA